MQHLPRSQSEAVYLVRQQHLLVIFEITDIVNSIQKVLVVLHQKLFEILVNFVVREDNVVSTTTLSVAPWTQTGIS